MSGQCQTQIDWVYNSEKNVGARPQVSIVLCLWVHLLTGIALILLSVKFIVDTESGLSQTTREHARHWLSCLFCESFVNVQFMSVCFALL